jgi:hypothetical protein
MSPSLLQRFLLSAGPWLAARLIRGIHRCQRVETIGDEPLQRLWGSRQPVILAFWHDQLLLMVCGYHGLGAKVLISASTDGEYIARTMAAMGVGAVRGSSTRGGKAAFREMLALAKDPCDLVFTPDGPKGPRHQVKEGVVQLARLTGRPVVPMAFACSRGRRFASWDRFLLPYPFARGVYAFGEPLYYDPAESTEDFCRRVQTAMEENVCRAAERLKNYGLSAV